MDKIKNNDETKCLAVVRGKCAATVKTAMSDLIRFAGLRFAGAPRVCAPSIADDILTQILKIPLRYHCRDAAIVQLANDAIDAISRVRRTHPPAHVIIVSPRYEIYYEIINFVNLLPELDMTFPESSTAPPQGATEHAGV